MEFLKTFYKWLCSLFDGVGKRKLFVVMTSLILLFTCAIFIPSAHKIITDSVFIGGVVAIVGAYISGNVLSKKIKTE